MHLASVRLVLLTGFWVSVNAVIESCILTIAFRSKTITAKSIWEHIGVWDQLACAVACMKDVRCKTLIYSPSKKTCLGYRSSLDNYKDFLTDDEEADTFVVRTCRADIQYSRFMDDPASNLTVMPIPHGQACRESYECDVQESVCYGGVCLCRPGLYFSPQHNACLKECVDYGDKMDFYIGADINEHNDKTMYVSLERCMEACVQEKIFTCLTLDWWPVDHTCHLSTYGYLDVEEKDRNHGTDWFLAQRQCRSTMNVQSQNTDLDVISATPHGHPCSRNDECSVQESVCYDGLCLCRLGLYFSPTQNTCLKECHQYGDAFDYYRKVSVSGHTVKRRSNIPLSECIEMCVQEKKFTCRMLKWLLKTRYCCLTAVGYLDIEKDIDTKTTWLLAQRRCK